MKIAHITLLLLVVPLSFLVSQPAFATKLGGGDLGWSIDFGQITVAQKKSFGWFDDELKLKFTRFSNTYASPGSAGWTLAGKVVAMHGIHGPAFFSITELLNNSSIEDVKKTHYRTMSDQKGFKEDSCTKTEQGAQVCEALLYNWSPPKVFYAVFYQWIVKDRVFVLVVRNAQPNPDRRTPEEAARVLIRLIQLE